MTLKETLSREEKKALYLIDYGIGNASQLLTIYKIAP